MDEVVVSALEAAGFIIQARADRDDDCQALVSVGAGNLGGLFKQARAHADMLGSAGLFGAHCQGLPRSKSQK